LTLVSTRPQLAALLLAPAALTLAAVIVARADVGAAGAQDRSSGWHIPQDAADEKSPLADSPEIVAKGKKIFESKCRRCHGSTGVGNGPDADPNDPPGNLTDARRASRNPDGVMFYKIWNGRSDPKMPAFKTDISRDDVWTVIQYVKTLRR
jgi:mono/diheme cytochrome c family protein